MHSGLLIAAALLQDQSNPQPSDNGVGWYLFLFIVFAVAGGYGLVAYDRHTRKFEAFLQEQGLTYVHTLPPTLKPPAIAWQPAFQYRSCYAGTRNGFRVVIFQTYIRNGEAGSWRNMVAVERAPFAQKLSEFLMQGVTIDTTSTPGWVIIANASRHVVAIRQILDALSGPE